MFAAMPKSHPVANVFSSRCPSRRVLAVLAEKWTLLVVSQLAHGPMRTAEIRRSVDGVSEKMLIQTLRKLEAFGLVSRQELPGAAAARGVPPHAAGPLAGASHRAVRPLGGAQRGRRCSKAERDSSAA